MAEEDPAPEIQEYKLVILGDGGVGKSALTIQFLHNKFIESYDPTIEETYMKTVTIDDEECSLNILDTAGQNEYAEARREAYMSAGEGFMIVYAANNRDTFEVVETYRSQLYEIRGIKKDGMVAMVLVANKTDLAREAEAEGDEATVSQEEGMALSDQMGIPFYECSAATGESIDEAYYELVRQVRRFRSIAARQEPESSGCCVLA